MRFFRSSYCHPTVVFLPKLSKFTVIPMACPPWKIFRSNPNRLATIEFSPSAPTSTSQTILSSVFFPPLDTFTSHFGLSLEGGETRSKEVPRKTRTPNNRQILRRVLCNLRI